MMRSGRRVVIAVCLLLVAGPAIVHSGGDVPLARLVHAGWIDVVLSGNAFATHDLEKAIVGTSLGVCQMSGRALDGGNGYCGAGNTLFADIARPIFPRRGKRRMIPTK